MASNVPELCPFDERRSPHELYTKLFIVNFVTVGAFGHLMHLRHERRGPFIYLLMILCPVAGAGLIIVPLTAFSIQAILHLGDKKVLKRSSALLIGRLPEEEHQEGGPILAQAGVWSTPRRKPEEKLFSAPKLTVRFYWTLSLQLVPFIQSVMTVWLFVRRHHEDGLEPAPYDYRIFQSAILGLSATFMSLIHLFTNPQYPSDWPEPDNEWRPGLMKLLRPTRKTEIYKVQLGNSVWDLQSMVVGVIEHFTAGAIFAIFRGFGMVSSYFSVTSFWGGGIFYVVYWFLEHHSRYVPILAALCVVQFRNRLSSIILSSRKGFAWAVIRATMAFMAFNFVIVSALFSLELLIECATGAIQSQTQLLMLFGKPWDFKRYEGAVYREGPLTPDRILPDWSRIWTFRHLPPSFPCPPLKKDPMADYVWWLA